MKKNFAYSLVELLTALSICLLLASLVLVAVSATKEGMRTKSCVSTIKMLGNAMILYIHDFDETYPPPITGVFETIEGGKAHAEGGIPWSQLLTPYVKTSTKQFPHCPSIDLKFIPEEIAEQNLCGFAYNGNLSESVLVEKSKRDTMVGIAEHGVRFSGLTILFCDARLGISSVKGPDLITTGKVFGISVTGLKPYILRQPAGATRHKSGANYAFTDGHVKWFKPDQLSTYVKCDGEAPGFGL